MAEKPKELDIIVDDYGDPSVGIFSGHWEVKGGIFIEDNDDREKIRKAFQEAFELVTDTPRVVFSDEIESEHS